MALLLDFLGDFAPFLMLAALLAAIVLAINMLGRHLERHDAWIAAIDARVDGLQKDRKATWARDLARPFAAEPTEPAPLVPPPLPVRPPTLNALDWRDDDAATEDLHTRQTGRYPQPPKGPTDDS